MGRKVVLILGSVAVMFSVAVTLLGYFLIGKADKEKNVERTEAARIARAVKREQEKQAAINETEKEVSNEGKI